MADDEYGMIIFVVLEFRVAVFCGDDTFLIVSENVIASSDSSGNWSVFESISNLRRMSWIEDFVVGEDEGPLFLLWGELASTLAELSFSLVWVSTSLKDHIVESILERVFKMTTKASKVERRSIEGAINDLLL